MEMYFALNIFAFAPNNRDGVETRLWLGISRDLMVGRNRGRLYCYACVFDEARARKRAEERGIRVYRFSPENGATSLGHGYPSGMPLYRCESHGTWRFSRSKPRCMRHAYFEIPCRRMVSGGTENGGRRQPSPRYPRS